MITQASSLRHPTPLNLNDFIRYEGTRECSGYTGIKNLLKLLKADVEAAFKEYGIQVPQQQKRLKELKSLIVPFNAHWEEWSGSSFCNLSPFEISLINLYRKKEDYHWVGDQLGISYDLALTSLIKAIWRLKRTGTEKLFQKWKDFKHMDKKNPDEFLELPLEGLHHIFSSRVFYLIKIFGNNMSEVLSKVTIRELRKCRGFGKKAENELKAILKEHQCLHLLKS